MTRDPVFEAEDKFYDQVTQGGESRIPSYPNHGEFYELGHQALVAEMERLGLAANSRVLIIGVGPGNKDGELLVSRSTSVYGIDVSPQALRLCRAHLPGLKAILGSAHALPFQSGAFDFVCFPLVIHHMTGQRIEGRRQALVHDALDEARRALCRNGRIVCLEPNLLFPSTLAIYPVNSLMQRVRPGWRGLVPSERNISPMQLRSLLKKHGFTHIEHHAATFANEKLPHRVFRWIVEHEAPYRGTRLFRSFGVHTVISGQR